MANRRRLLLQARAGGGSIFYNEGPKDGYSFSDMSDKGWLMQDGTTTAASLNPEESFIDDGGNTRTALALTTLDSSSSGAAAVSCVMTAGLTGKQLKRYGALRVEYSVLNRCLTRCMVLYTDLSGDWYGNAGDAYAARVDLQTSGTGYGLEAEIPLDGLNDNTTYYIGFREQTGAAQTYAENKLLITKLWLE